MWSRSFAQCVQRVLKTEAALYSRVASHASAARSACKSEVSQRATVFTAALTGKVAQSRFQGSLLPAAALITMNSYKPKFPPSPAAMHNSAATTASLDVSSDAGSGGVSASGSSDGALAGDEASEATLSQTRGHGKIGFDPGDPGPPDPSLNFEEFLKVMVHPIPSTEKDKRQLYPFMVNVNGSHFIDPNMTMMSTMRALHVIRAVLEQDGHVYVVNSNPLMRPLLKEAAHCCLNPNVWFFAERWVQGTITNERFVHRLWKPEHQPNRARFARRGLPFVNVHCPEKPVLHQPPPELDAMDKWRLWYKRGGGDMKRGQDYRKLLKDIVHWEEVNARLPISDLGPAHRQLRLVVVLDATYNHLALKEAHSKNIITLSTVAHNIEMGHVTYPIYAREFTPNYQHFLLDWILKVVNLRTPQ